MIELSPAQKAQGELYVAKYIATAMRTAPQGTIPRKAMFEAAQAFMEALPTHRLSKYEWLDYSKDDPYLLHRLGQEHEKQDSSVCYVITGNWYDLLDMLRHPKFCGKQDVSGSMMAAQGSAHAAADLMFRTNVLQEEELLDAALALDGLVKTCGMVHIFQNAIFVSDPPLGITSVGVRSWKYLWTQEACDWHNKQIKLEESNEIRS